MSAPLDPSMLLKAYAAGVFPMADTREAAEVYWVEPDRRGVLPLDGFRLSKSMAKVLKSGRFETTADAAFADVVKLCAEAAEDRPVTWINSQIEVAVGQLHAAGHAHSIETWEGGQLVGGLYGISLGGAFFGESMFSRVTNASKVALAHLIARLRVGGYQLLDCQFITPHLATMGAIEIGKADYLAQLYAALPISGDYSVLDSSYAAAASSPPCTIVVSGPTSGYFIAQALVQTS
jgi:leucyl/phenylalanyl-tRNA---protein transferase